ncbi:hypothetical protein Tco_1445208 [Tanacetum coccineum]
MHIKMVKQRLFKTSDFLISLDEHLATFRGNEYAENERKTKQNGQNQAQEWEEYEKSKPKAYLYLMGQPVPILMGQGEPHLATTHTKASRRAHLMPSDTLSSHAGNPQQFDWLLRRVLDPTAQNKRLGGGYDWKAEMEDLGRSSLA